MSAGFNVGVYRTLAALYPKAFRDEYRDDLVAAFAAQCRDQSVGRVWLRTLRDLIVTVPNQHLESRMKRPSPHSVAVVALSIAVGVSVLALASGTGPTTWIFLVVALGALLVAGLSWAAARPARADTLSERLTWWKLAGSGIAVLAVVIGLINIPIWGEGDLPGPMWVVMMLSLVGGVSLLAAGLALGTAHWFTRNRAIPKSAQPRVG